MFVAMNRFRIAKGSEEIFEKIWIERDSKLEEVPGFKQFHLLKGPEREDHVLYTSHSVWESRGAFEAWTKSEHFRAAHKDAGRPDTQSIYLGPPELELFEAVEGA